MATPLFAPSAALLLPTMEPQITTSAVDNEVHTVGVGGAVLNRCSEFINHIAAEVTEGYTIRIIDQSLLQPEHDPQCAYHLYEPECDGAVTAAIPHTSVEISPNAPFIAAVPV